MLGTMRNLSGSHFIIVVLTVMTLSIVACGGGGSGGDDPPAATIPTVLSTTPVDNTSQVLPAANMVITFSTAMNIAAVESALTINPAASATYSWNAGVTELTISPDSDLTEDTLYTVTVGVAAADADGTAIETAYSFDFTTGDVPFVADSSPSPGETSASPDEWVGFLFSEAMNQNSVEANLSILPTAAYTTRWDKGYSVLYMDFTHSLAASTSYAVTIGSASTDLEGTAMGTAEVLSFTTEKRPTISGTNPAHGDTSVSLTADFVITFDDIMGSSAQNFVSVQGYGGIINSSMESGGTVIRLAFDSDLDTTTVYTVQVGAAAENSNGTHLDTSYEFVFSTGPALTGQTVSGTVSDPSGTVSGADVRLMTRNSDVSDWYYDFAKQTTTDGSGDYSMSLVQADIYWPAAVEDTNGDGLTHLQYGDAFGIANSITVAVSDLTNVDITLHDPEAISGSILYNGNYSTEIYAAADSLMLYAYTGSEAITGEMYLTNDVSGTAPGPVNLYNNSEDWTYWLNPYLDPAISVDGSLFDDSVVQNGLTFIPTGSYNLLAMINDGSGNSAAGFAQAAAISGSGDDATGVNITLYDLIGIAGRVEVIDDIDTNAPYGSAQVSLLNWPLLTTVSSAYWDTEYPTGGYYLDNTPAGLPVAVHAEPDPADAASYAAYNAQYTMWSTSDDGEEVDIQMISKSLMDTIAAQAGTTVQAGKATILAFVQASEGSSTLTVAGATVSLSTGDQAFYADTGLNFGYPYTQYMGADGPPSVIFFNVDPDGAGVSDGIATITTTHPDGTFSFETVYVPVRADELTFAQVESETGYAAAAGFTLSGFVEDVSDESPFIGATVLMHDAVGAVLNSTVTDSIGAFAFLNVPSGSRGYLSASDSGFVTMNTEIVTVTSDIDVFIPLVPEAMAASVVSLLDGFSEPSWNSTLQSYTWYLADIEFSGGGATSGVQLTLDATGATTAYYNSATGLYDASATTSQGSGGPMVMGYAPNSSAGAYSIHADNSVNPGTKDIPLVAGEMTYIEWTNYN